VRGPISLAWELFVIAVDAALNPASDPIVGEADIVRRFLSWMQRAPAEERADAASALARAYLHSRLPEAVRSEAVLALTSVLDDPSALVRRALAEALASASNAPRHIVLGLASDQSEVSRIVLALSPVLDDSELVDCAATGDDAAQIAVARRPHLPPSVAAALAEMGERPGVLALAGNLDAELTNAALRRIFDRFGEDPAVREKLSTRAGLPAALRADIAAATSRALAQVAAGPDWLNPRRAERIARDAREQAIVAIARTCPPRELAELVARQRKSGALTVALLMRALVSGDSGLFRQTLVELSGLPEGRVAGFFRNFRGQGFAALYGKAGLPGHFLPAFRAALGVLADGASPRDNQISHNLTMRLIRACEKLADPNLAPILSMLWRFACESARDDAQEFVADAAMQETVLSIRQVEHEAIEQEDLEASPPIVLDNEAPGENFAPPVELELEAPVELELAPPEKVADAA
jgi:uncharacterized protein (DUF2336 family)